jgi:hypothetical protein
LGVTNPICKVELMWPGPLYLFRNANTAYEPGPDFKRVAL